MQGQVGAVATFAVYGDANGERVILGWFVDEAKAVKLRDVLSEALAANQAAHSWNKRQRDGAR